jgi:hypothetical protein
MFRHCEQKDLSIYDIKLNSDLSLFLIVGSMYALGFKEAVYNW